MTSGALRYSASREPNFSRFAFRLIDPAERVGLGLFLALFGLAARIRNGVIVNRPGLIDRGLLFLLRLVHLVEGRLHDWRRPHRRQLHLLNLQTKPVLRAQSGQPVQGGRLDVVPADGQHLIDRAIADDLAHDALGKIAQRFLRLARAEQVQPSGR